MLRRVALGDAEPCGMALTQAEVDEFMAAEKVVPRDPAAPMKWAAPVPSRRMWRGRVEIEGRRLGEVLLLANPSLPRAWTYKLDYRSEPVYRIDVKSGPARHPNPTRCPSDFPPGKVRGREHEHIYMEGLDCECARPLGGLGSSGHRAILDEFCTRARIRFLPGYESPLLFAQMQML
jgi:hypothetical protein